MPDARVFRDRQHLLANQHELQVFRQPGQRVQEEREQLVAPFVLIDATDIQGKRAGDCVFLPEAFCLRPQRNLRPNPDHDARNLVVSRDRLDQALLFLAVVHQCPDAAEDAPRHPKSNGLIALGRRHENGAGWQRRCSVVGVIVAIAEKEDVVVSCCRRSQMPNEPRALRPFGVEPFQLVIMRMRVIEHPVGPPPERERIAWMIDAKPANRHAIDYFGPGLIVVTPRNVIARARRQHFDLRVLRQVLSDIAGVQLGAAVDVGAVALHHDSQLHCAEGSGSSPESSPCSDA